MAKGQILKLLDHKNIYAFNFHPPSNLSCDTLKLQTHVKIMRRALSQFHFLTIENLEFGTLYQKPRAIVTTDLEKFSLSNVIFVNSTITLI